MKNSIVKINKGKQKNVVENKKLLYYFFCNCFLFYKSKEK